MEMTNFWPILAERLKPALQTGIKNTADAMAGFIVGNAPEETGFMASNIYVSTWDSSTYGSGSGPPTDDVYLLEEVTSPDDMTAIVGAAANYSEWVNYGHHTRSGSYVPANPFFDRGVEQARGVFESDMAAAMAEGLAI